MARASRADRRAVILLRREECTLVKYPSGDKVNRESKSEPTNLPEGPYLINTRSGKVHAVARRFEDSLQAFTGGGVAYNAEIKKYRFVNSQVLLQSHPISHCLQANL
jgi:hypothetical protein